MSLASLLTKFATFVDYPNPDGTIIQFQGRNPFLLRIKLVDGLVGYHVDGLVGYHIFRGFKIKWVTPYPILLFVLNMQFMKWIPSL